MTSRLLLLVHRIPFPPDKGDKIRSYHLLRHLATRHSVYLGAFVDDPADWQYETELSRLCRQVKLVGLDPLKRKLGSLSGLLTGQALSVPYYRSDEMQGWVDETLSVEHIRHVVVFSSTMAQFVLGRKYAGLRRVADLCDVDSDKWRQYALGKRAPMKWVYAREARALLDYERAVAREFDASLFVTKAEADLFRSLAPESSGKVSAFDNGVDTVYFNPDEVFESPYLADGDRSKTVDALSLQRTEGGPKRSTAPVVIFTGAMDYWANVDAVTWFAEKVWPLVREQAAQARFYIVGSKPGAQVKGLERHPGLHVTGRVPDIRPWLAHAHVAVAPLRIARGTQNKVLEALAMAKPVVCTPAAAEGLRVPISEAFRVEEEPSDYARAVLELFGHGSNREGRESVVRDYSWTANLRIIDELLAEGSA